MRNMSFALTIEPMQNGEKDVTRRMGWLHLKVGENIQPVRKCMGLKPGEKIEQISSVITVKSITRESLCRMIDEPEYGQEECKREGFPNLTPTEFVQMFVKSHKGCTPQSIVTRIEFKRVEK